MEFDLETWRMLLFSMSVLWAIPHQHKEERHAKSAKRQDILVGRPIACGPDQYSRGKRSANRERVANIAQEALAKVCKQHTGSEKSIRAKLFERVQREGVDIVRKTRFTPIRMCQFDLKYEVD